MRHLMFILLSSVFGLMVASSPVYAVETHVSQPQSFEVSNPLELQITVTGAQIGQNFLKAEFFKKDTTEYFGETYNGSSWYSGSDYQNYLPIEITSSGWQGNMQVRIPQNHNLDRGGEYFIRVRRFTKAGNYSAEEARDSAVSVLPQFTNIESTILPSSTPTLTVVPSSFIPSYSLITINEVYPHPLDGEKEWVELYNFNDFSVSLENWYIDDIEGGSYPKPFSILIPAKSLAVIDIPTSILNNGGDTVRLLDSQKNLKDSILFDEAKAGESLGKQSVTDSSVCVQSPSRGKDNSSCISPTLKPSATTMQKPSPSPVFTSSEISNITPKSFVTTSTPFPYHVSGIANNIVQKKESLFLPQPQVLGASSSPKRGIYRGLQRGMLMGAISTLLINCIYICTTLVNKYKQDLSLQFI